MLSWPGWNSVGGRTGGGGQAIAGLSGTSAVAAGAAAFDLVEAAFGLAAARDLAAAVVDRVCLRVWCLALVLGI